MIPDVNSLSKLERDANGLPTRLKNGWRAELDRVSRHFAFLSDQTEAAEKELANKSAEIDEWFLQPENALEDQEILSRPPPRPGRRGIARVPAVPADACLQG